MSDPTVDEKGTASHMTPAEFLIRRYGSCIGMFNGQDEAMAAMPWWRKFADWFKRTP